MSVFKLDDFIKEKYYNKNLVIEASAGTGKTHNITGIVRKLVENLGVNPTKILIVTYTEKATGELKDRIRNELNNVKNINRDDLDNLNIYTIHSFCQNSIKEFGLESKKPLKLDVIDEKEELSSFYDNYVRTNPNILSDINNIYNNELDRKDDNGELKVVFRPEGNGANSKSLKDYIIGIALMYHLDSSGNIEKEIISFKDNPNNVLIDKYLYGNAFDEFYKDSVFKANYDYALGNGDSILKYFVKCLKDRISNNEYLFSLKIDVKKSFDEWNISAQEKDAIRYFYDLKDNKNLRINYSTFIDFENSNSQYQILRDSNNEECKLFAYYIKSNHQVKSKLHQIDLKVNDSISIGNANTQNDILLEQAKDFFVNLEKKLNKINLYEYLVKKYFINGNFYKEWQAYKEKNKWQSFNDMLRDIRETLKNEAGQADKPFTNALKDKYEYAIIDEFQDTNQLQFDTFKYIFMTDDNHKIIVVGDPKQSIYSFQGADLNVYLEAKKYISNNNGLVLELDTNYRSSKKMIESCNKMFSGEFFTVKDKTRDVSLTFSESKSPDSNNRKAIYNSIDDTKAIWVGMNEAKPDTTPSEELEGKEAKKNIDNRLMSVDDYAKLVVSTIVDCCKKDANKRTKLQLIDKNGVQRNVTFRDFAILSRTRSEVEPITRELKKCGVPFIKYKDDGLFKTRECAHFATLLEAINTPDFTGYNRKKYYKALYTDFFGNTLEEINDEYFSHDVGFEAECFRKWKELFNNSRWEALFENIIFESKLLNNLESLDKLQSLTLYKQLGDYCISYLYSNHSFANLIDKLNNVSLEDDDDSSDAGIVEIGTDFDCVKLMTIHASKGLQYPIVISIAGYKQPFGFSFGTFHDDMDNLYRKITFDKDDSDLEAKSEYVRLLYVCFTRAEYINILPYFSIAKSNYYYDCYMNRLKEYMKNNSDDYMPLYFDSKYDSDAIVKSVKEILKNTGTKDEAYKDVIKPKDLITEVFKKTIKKHSYSSLSHPKNKDNDDDIRKQNPLNDISLKEFDTSARQIENIMTSNDYISYEKYPRGDKMGSAMHEVFERIDFTNYQDRKKLDAIITERLQANMIEAKSDLIDYIADVVDNVLQAKLPKINGSSANGYFRLNEIADENKKSEIEFNFNLDEKVDYDYIRDYCTGFMDLLFRVGDHFSILDWKSDTLNDDFESYGNNKSLKEHTDEHYSIQRVLYSYSLIKWLNEIYKEKTLDETYDKHFGGIYYVYIRGCKKDEYNGIYAQTWDSFEKLEESYEKVLNRAKKRGGK